KMRAAWVYPVCGCVYKTNPLCKGDAPLVLSNTRLDNFAGNRIRNKDGALIMASQGTATVRHCGQFNFKGFVCHGIRIAQSSIFLPRFFHTCAILEETQGVLRCVYAILQSRLLYWSWLFWS